MSNNVTNHLMPATGLISTAIRPQQPLHRYHRVVMNLSVFPCSRRNCLFSLLLALVALIVGGLSPRRCMADVTANVSIWHGYDFYYPGLDLSSTNPPVTYHWMENASGKLWKQFGDTNGVNDFFLTNELNAVIRECTNGLWKLYLNRGDASQQLYFFKMSIAGVTTNVLGDVHILSPVSGSFEVTNQPTYVWTGPTNLPTLNAHSSPPVPNASVSSAGFRGSRFTGRRRWPPAGATMAGDQAWCSIRSWVQARLPSPPACTDGTGSGSS